MLSSGLAGSSGRELLRAAAGQPERSRRSRASTQVTRRAFSAKQCSKSNSATGSSSSGPPRTYVEFLGAFRHCSQNLTVESGRGRPRGVEQVLAELGVHAAWPGKSSGARKLSPSPAPDAVIGARWQQWPRAAASSRGSAGALPEVPGVKHMTRRAFSCTAMLRE